MNALSAVTTAAATTWRRPGWRRVHQGLDALSTYLPIVLMALLALGTYWLARNTPDAPLPAGPRALTHEPDYFMRGFSVKTFDADGRLKSEVRGTEARHFPDSDTIEIDNPRILSFSERGLRTRATARTAITNADGSEVQLVGNAVVTRDGGTDRDGRPAPTLEFRGEFLHAFLQTERVRSHKPVTITRGNDQFQADGLVFDNVERVLDLQGRVRGTLQPRNAR